MLSSSQTADVGFPTSLGVHTHAAQYKSLGAPQVNRAYLQRALLDENVQYLLLALYWFLQVSPALSQSPV